ncbi:MAG: sxtJ [Candidatus Omnitrophica bacterium]|nr:sxtJ [Candidatus Omnitrophota bacterium]MBU1869075.1 sxtJ [Candidatus Omnitrophota bacterium]
MEKLDLSRRNLKKFGLTMSAAFCIISLLIFIKHKHSSSITLSISAAFLFLGSFCPGSLKLIYIPWMRLAHILGWLNTKLILIILFYLVFTPIGLIIRLFRNDLLDRKINRHKKSYWNKHPEVAFKAEDYEKQY